MPTTNEDSFASVAQDAIEFGRECIGTDPSPTLISLTKRMAALAKPPPNLPPREEWLEWKRPVTFGKGKTAHKRMLVPMSDPMQDEHPFDLLFTSEELALQALKDHDIVARAKREKWVLCRVTYTPVRTAK